jgi:hypothetical protein
MMVISGDKSSDKCSIEKAIGKKLLQKNLTNSKEEKSINEEESHSSTAKGKILIKSDVIIYKIYKLINYTII